MAFYYTAGIRFGDADMLERHGRRFGSTDEMDEAIIGGINGRCGEDDVLVILGDVTGRGNTNGSAACLERIRAKKVLVTSSTDAAPLRSRKFRECFEDIADHELIRDGVHRIFLSHYPMAEWEGFYGGVWHFYGRHAPSSPAGALMELLPTAVCAALDANGLVPKTADELMDARRKNYAPPDTAGILSRTVYGKPDGSGGAKAPDLSGFVNLTKDRRTHAVYGAGPKLFRKVSGAEPGARAPYDVALAEKNGTDGLSQLDVHNLFSLTRGRSVYPLEVGSKRSGRTAMGYIASDAARKVGYDYSEMGRRIAEVLDDAGREDPSGRYEFDGLSIFLSG